MRFLERFRHKANATIDLDAPHVARDPYPFYEQLRRTGPVQFLRKHKAWIVLGYDEVQSVMARPAVFSNHIYQHLDPVLLGADPPEHTAIRRLVMSRFSGDALERLSAFAARSAAELVRPELDVVTGYARPLSESVAAHFLGLDAAAVAAIRAAEAKSRTFFEFAGALLPLTDRAELYAELTAGGMSEADARSLTRLLWLASTKSVERSVGHAIRLLLVHDDVRRSIQSDRALLTPFIEEALRLRTPELIVRRQSKTAATIGTVEVPANAVIFLCIAAANRDPAKFDDPATLRLDRNGARALSFGFGTHHCVGAALARREIDTAIRTLFEHAPRFRAAEDLDRLGYSTAHFTAHPLDRLLIGL